MMLIRSINKKSLITKPFIRLLSSNSEADKVLELLKVEHLDLADEITENRGKEIHKLLQENNITLNFIDGYKEIQLVTEGLNYITTATYKTVLSDIAGAERDDEFNSEAEEDDDEYEEEDHPDGSEMYVSVPFSVEILNKQNGLKILAECLAERDFNEKDSTLITKALVLEAPKDSKIELNSGGYCPNFEDLDAEFSDSLRVYLESKGVDIILANSITESCEYFENLSYFEWLNDFETFITAKDE